MAIKRNLKLKKPQLRKPSTAPIDVVRNPNFPAALAQQEYQNSIADFRARMLAEQNAANALGVKYIATMGTSKPMQTDGNQDFIDSRDPNKATTMDMVDYIDPATGEKTSRTRGVVPAPGSRFVPANQAGLYNELQRNQNPIGGPGGQQSTNSTAGYVQVDPMDGVQNNRSIYDSLRPDYSQVGTVPMRSPENPNQSNFGQIAQGIGRLMPQIPQGQQQQMQSYQNFLNQGMNNMASVNQGAAESFANTQPGIPTTGSAQQFTANPAMPVAGMGAQKSRPTPRKFSTVSNSPARFA